jgi:hypothetical protein
MQLIAAGSLLDSTSTTRTLVVTAQPTVAEIRAPHVDNGGSSRSTAVLHHPMSDGPLMSALSVDEVNAFVAETFPAAAAGSEPPLVVVDVARTR